MVRIERALAIVSRIGAPRRAMSRPFHRTATPYVTPKPRMTYTPTPRPIPWTWAAATPRERGEWVRMHFNKYPKLTGENLCYLFNLNLNGLVEIIRGKDWAPEYDNTSPQ